MQTTPAIPAPTALELHLARRCCLCIARGAQRAANRAFGASTIGRNPVTQARYQHEQARADLYLQAALRLQRCAGGGAPWPH